MPGRRCGPAYKVGLTDADGNAWPPATLAAYLEEHNIRPEALLDLSHLKPWNEGSPWTDPYRILRAIERDTREDSHAELRRLIKDDAEVRRAVIDICSVVNDNPYDPGLYQRWLAFARQYD